MQKPIGVKQAVVAIWITIILSALTSLINQWLGHISPGQFVFAILVYGLFCILPYKIDRGSNGARWAYLVLMVIGIIFMVSGIEMNMPILDLILSVMLIPVEIFILWRLFQQEASEWFVS